MAHRFLEIPYAPQIAAFFVLCMVWIAIGFWPALATAAMLDMAISAADLRRHQKENVRLGDKDQS